MTDKKARGAQKRTDKPAERPRVSRSAVGDTAGAASLGRRIAESLRVLRKQRSLSLDDLAAASGVSRAALSQIEGCRTNPTIGVLWKIAVGLGVPFQLLLGEEDAGAARVLRAGDATVLRSVDGRVESRLLSPAGAATGVDVYELRIRSRGLLRSEAHSSGTTETVHVLSGSVRVVVRDETHELAPGDTIFFRADAPHSYENRGTNEACVLDVIAYPPKGA